MGCEYRRGREQIETNCYTRLQYIITVSRYYLICSYSISLDRITNIYKNDEEYDIWIRLHKKNC